MKTQKLAISKIRIDTRTQMRVAGLQQDVVDDYVAAMRAHATFPAVDVYYDGSVYWLADGFHRVAAYRTLRVKTIDANVYDGTVRDALLHAVQSNVRHGLRATRADRRNAVDTLLLDAEWTTWTARKIGELCGVDGKTVDARRKALGLETTTRTMLRAGKVLTIETSNIGAKKQTASSTAEVPQSAPNRTTTATLSEKDQRTVDKIAADYGWSQDDARVYVQCLVSKRQQDRERREQRKAEQQKQRQQVARRLRRDLTEQKRSRLQAELQTVSELARQYAVPASVVLAVLQSDAERKR
jgi:polyhydroxyalkanoate synthesis regulator phasin